MTLLEKALVEYIELYRLTVSAREALQGHSGQTAPEELQTERYFTDERLSANYEHDFGNLFRVF